MGKMTTKGALWVIGTPLFEEYYVRWSWPQEQRSPEVFLKPVAEAAACREPAALSEHDPEAEAETLPGSRLMRSERRNSAQGRPALQRASRGSDRRQVRTMTLDEIRYPHWVWSL